MFHELLVRDDKCNYKLMFTWDESAVVAVQIGEALCCVENSGIAVTRDLLEVKK